MKKIGCGIALLLAASALTGCSAGGGSSTGFGQALGQIAANDKWGWIEYGDLKTMNEAAGGKALGDDRFQTLAGLGASELLQNWVPLGKDKEAPLGIDPLKAERMIALRPKPGSDMGGGLLFGGLDIASVEKKLQADGAGKTEIDGGATWKLGADKERPGKQNRFDTVYTGEGMVGYADSPSTVDVLRKADGQSLAEDTRLKPLVDCLGDVTVARVMPGVKELDVDLVAAGVRASDPKNATEVMCVLMTSEARATTVAGKAPKTLPGQSGTKEVTASIDGNLVKIEGKPGDKQLGRYIMALGSYAPLGIFTP